MVTGYGTETWIDSYMQPTSISFLHYLYICWISHQFCPSDKIPHLVVKNHSFVDGNKRISDASLVALTLMIAESHTEEMDTMVKVVVSLINRRN